MTAAPTTGGNFGVGRLTGVAAMTLGAAMACFLASRKGLIFAFIQDMYAHVAAPFATLFLLGVVQSAGGIISFILVASMIADVVEDSEVSTGRRSEGLFFAAASLVQKAVSGVGVFVSSLVLTLAHFPVGVRPAEIDPAILQRLITIYVPVLLALYGAGIGLMYLYGIDRRIHEANLRKLQSG